MNSEQPFNNPFANLKDKMSGEQAPENFPEPNSREDSKQEVSAEKEKIFPKGKYGVSVEFIDRKGVTKNLEIREMNTWEDTSEEEMKLKARSEISAVGLHNFGMDVYYKNYPDGHPVKITVRDASDNSVVQEFTQKFDGSGYPVKKK